MLAPAANGRRLGIRLIDRCRITQGRQSVTQPVASPLLPRQFGRIQWVGVWTLYTRDLRRYFREWLESIVAPVFTSLLWVAVFTFALGPDRSTPEGQAAFSFILPALVLFAGLTRSAETTTFSLMFDRMEGILADVLMPPLTPQEITAAYALGGATTGIVTASPVLAVMLVVPGFTVVAPAAAAVTLVLSCLMLSLIGIVTGIACRKWDHMAAVFGFILIPMAFLSGMFGPIAAMPDPVATVLTVSPLFHAFNAFRAATIGVSEVSMLVSLSVISVWVVGLWVLAGALIHRGWRIRD